MTTKALARFLYASIPGLAAARFVVKDLAAPYFPKAEYYGVRRLLPPGGLIVDVGANRGQSIAAFKSMAPESTVVAFEPEPISVGKLVSRYRYDDTVTIYGCALGEQTEIKTIFVPSYGRWSCDGMAATNFEDATSWLRDPSRMLRYDEQKLNVKTFLIECKTLDSFTLEPSVLKIHAQGAELQIVRGSIKTIIQHRPALMCAFPTGEVKNLLSDLGYQPYVFVKSEFITGVASPTETFTWFLTDEHLGLQSPQHRDRVSTA